jgi:hypothetical protein
MGTKQTKIIEEPEINIKQTDKNNHDFSQENIDDVEKCTIYNPLDINEKNQIEDVKEQYKNAPY